MFQNLCPLNNMEYHCCFQPPQAKLLSMLGEQQVSIFDVILWVDMYCILLRGIFFLGILCNYQQEKTHKITSSKASLLRICLEVAWQTISLWHGCHVALAKRPEVTYYFIRVMWDKIDIKNKCSKLPYHLWNTHFSMVID